MRGRKSNSLGETSLFGLINCRNIPIALFDPDGCRAILGERYRLFSSTIIGGIG